MHPRGTNSWEHNAPKSNKLLELQSHKSLWRAQPDATNAMASPSLRNPTKATNAMDGFKMKNKEENHQELQNQDLLGSRHLEEEWIGGNVDLDPLSL